VMNILQMIYYYGQNHWKFKLKRFEKTRLFFQLKSSKSQWTNLNQYK